MEMQYFFSCDQVERGIFKVEWHPGLENMGDYHSKHHTAAHHRHVRPFYLHEPTSPTELLRALEPRELKKVAPDERTWRGPLRAINANRADSAESMKLKRNRIDVASSVFKAPLATNLNASMRRGERVFLSNVFLSRRDLRGCVGTGGALSPKGSSTRPHSQARSRPQGRRRTDHVALLQYSSRQ